MAVREVGEVRPSQLLYSYGVGAIIDLPNISVAVLGLEDWDRSRMTPVSEPRLLAAAQRHVGAQLKKLLAPPRKVDDGPGADPTGDEIPAGIPVLAFPRWLYCTGCRLLAPVSQGAFELKYDSWRPDKTGYEHAYCSFPPGRHPAYPARFLLACRNGHLDDFPWDFFVHRGVFDCPGPLRLLNLGPAGEAREVEVSCQRCTSRRRMSEAFGESGAKNLPQCRGRRVHLRDEEQAPCKEEPRAILIGASNIWFPVTLGVLSIPTSGNKLEQAVADLWTEYLEHASTPAEVALLMKMPPLRRLASFTADQVCEAVEAYRNPPAKPAAVDLKRPEWELFTSPGSAPSTPDFKLREVPVPTGTESWLERVVLVERLREVQTTFGFTRIDSATDEESDEEKRPKRAPLSRKSTEWLPAVEVRGEGLFLQVREDALGAWTARPEVVKQAEAGFLAAHTEWRRRRGISPPEAQFPGLRYVFLHSLSHAVVRQLSLECGYSAASLRERLYSSDPGDATPMAGILLYTAAADSEGTLGGLTGLGAPEELGRHLAAALEDARLCAADPLCSDHRPTGDGTDVHGAACHACLFSPETFCERGNRFLDRNVLADTVAGPRISLFGPADPLGIGQKP
jgi:hypothetical protein